MNLPDLSDDQTLAAALGCEPETVQARALAGELPGVKFGRSWVFPREAVLEALNRAARQQAESRAAGVAALSIPQKTKRRLPVLPGLK